MARRIGSEKVELVKKSRECALSAVQIYNNPNITFKTETYIVLFVIAWTYLLHAYYRGQGIEYRFHKVRGDRKQFIRNPDGTIRYWDLSACINSASCPLDRDTRNNLRFLIGLRNQIEHKKAVGLDSYLSARYQACALNYNHYVKHLFGERFGMDQNLALSLQFAELDYEQSVLIKDRDERIPKEIRTYIAAFDHSLSSEEMESERFAYRLVFTKVLANRKGQADRVIEFVAPNSPNAEAITKEYWIKVDREKPKFSARQVVEEIRGRGFSGFGIHQHTLLWREHDGKNPAKGFGTIVVKTWYWYQNWIDYIAERLAP